MTERTALSLAVDAEYAAVFGVKYNADEPRDDHGKWTSGGASYTGGTEPLVHGLSANDLHDAVEKVTATAHVEQIVSTLRRAPGAKMKPIKDALVAATQQAAYEENPANQWPKGHYLTGAKQSLHGAIARLALEQSLGRKDYNPDEPRDEHGRWTSDGQGGGSAPNIQETSTYQGRSAINDPKNFQMSGDYEEASRQYDQLSAQQTAQQKVYETMHAILYPTEEAKRNFLHVDPTEKIAKLAGIDPEAARGFDEAWSGASSTSSLGTLLQTIAAEKFGTTISPELQATADSWKKSWTPQQVDDAKKYIDATYEETQRTFKTAGITEVPVYRFMYMNSPESQREANLQQTGTQEATVSLRPLSSWSFTRDTFEGKGITDSPDIIVMSGWVPVHRVLSTYGTGLGDVAEQEAVLLGGKMRISYSGYTPPQRGGKAADPSADRPINQKPDQPKAPGAADGESVWQIDEIDPDWLRRLGLANRYERILSPDDKKKPKPGQRKDWDESKHPRVPAGQTGGGEFTGLGAITPADVPSDEANRAAIDTFARANFERADQAGMTGSYGDLADSLDLRSLNKVRGQEIIDRSNGKLGMSDVKRWAEAWGKYSGGQDWAALQSAASRVFGTPLGTAAPRVASLQPPEEDIRQAEEFVKATYQATQAELTRRGVTSMNLYRGVGYSDAAAPPTYQQAAAHGEAIGEVPTKPLNAYGVDYSVTTQFGDNFQGLNPNERVKPYAQYVTVPKERIFGSSFAGIGVPREGEYVVVGGPIVARVRARRSRGY